MALNRFGRIPLILTEAKMKKAISILKWWVLIVVVACKVSKESTLDRSISLYGLRRPLAVDSSMEATFSIDVDTFCGFTPVFSVSISESLSLPGYVYVVCHGRCGSFGHQRDNPFIDSAYFKLSIFDGLAINGSRVTIDQADSLLVSPSGHVYVEILAIGPQEFQELAKVLEVICKEENSSRTLSMVFIFMSPKTIPPVPVIVPNFDEAND